MATAISWSFLWRDEVNVNKDRRGAREWNSIGRRSNQCLEGNEDETEAEIEPTEIPFETQTKRTTDARHR